MGRWSEWSAVIVCHVDFICIVDEAVVMSGEVFFCVLLFGVLVGVFVLSMMCGEFWMRCAMCFPLWSSVDECQACEWAFMSAVMIEFGVFVA